MADLARHRTTDCRIVQAFSVLKKGTQLLKYGRQGKPKFYAFRLSKDESSLIWISSKGQKSLKLASVSKILPGQRTAVFRRYLRPEKDYLSFSLIYRNGKRSLDVICKNKIEADLWIAGLKALVSSGQHGLSTIDGLNDGSIYTDDGTDLTSTVTSDSLASANTRVSRSPEVSFSFNTIPSLKSFGTQSSVCSEMSHVGGFDYANVQLKGSGSDAFRVSVSSSVPSSSSYGSGPDDCDAFSDIYIWGEVICESYVKVGVDKNSNFFSTRMDLLLPRPLESNVVLDVHHIACGVKHAALVTRQGEVFTWGEESGGRLGHGVGDVTHPRFLDSLAICNVDLVSCGEFHTCAVTMSGELYTWGDGTHHAGILGNGTNVSCSIPKRILGNLEGLQVTSVTCGPWHTALVTSTGQLFTFGDGTFGVLGHGNRENVLSPREIESLAGLRTISVSCGVWHTAAVVEVIVTHTSASVSSGKLFTWGDGDKNRLGHGDKEACLKPTCVSPLIDHNFHKVSCGHSLTVGLATTGQVFTMGSSIYGQLGNLYSDGKLPCMVEDKLIGESVEDIACGAFHVAVLTVKNEIYTWGKGANGRLGHGDNEDRKTPSLVETLKDRHVKYIACGSNYTAAICLNKWVSGTEQSQCSSCRQAFGFTRKRHNCYNCGLVHCHNCSSRKALKAAMAPNPNKPYRVCDSCHAKLIKVSESSLNRRNIANRLSGENKDRLDRADLRLSKTTIPSNLDLIKQLDTKAVKYGKKADMFMSSPSPQSPLLQLKDNQPDSVDLWKPVSNLPVTQSIGNSRPTSPFSTRLSPSRSPTPVLGTYGTSFSKNITDNLKKTNDLLTHEVHKLRMQAQNFRHKCQLQELEVQNSAKKAQEATILLVDESAKSKAAKEVIKSLTAQLNVMGERLKELDPNGSHFPDTCGQYHSRYSSTISDIPLFGTLSLNVKDQSHRGIRSPRMSNFSSFSDNVDGESLYGHLQDGQNRTKHKYSGSIANGSQAFENDAKPQRNSGLVTTKSNQVEAEWIEQYEPGVYITIAIVDGGRDLKRVRFSRRRFIENQAEGWWSENRAKVYEKYNIRVSDKPSIH